MASTDQRTYAEVVDNRDHHDEETQPTINGHRPHRSHHSHDSEPLLGRPGAALQRPNAPMISNLYLGTGFLSVLGLLVVLISLTAIIASHKTLPLVTPHLFFQSLGAVSLVLAILVLQPTSHSVPDQKRLAARWHASLQVLSFLLFTAGVTVIEVNKHVNHMAHFHSAHAALGVATYALLVLQYLFGFTIYATPAVWGGEDKAKSLYKWHRYAGYAILAAVLATVSAANWTDYVHKALGLPTFVLPLGAALVVLGIFPRVQKSKFGYVRV